MIGTMQELDLLGDALQRAWKDDYRRRAPRTWTRRRLTIVLVMAIVLIGTGAAIASSVLKSAADEEQGLLEGYALFNGTQPSCQQLTPTSFTCVLDKAPTGITFYDADGRRLLNAYLGVKAETVDSHKRVDGGCVATAADGRAWRCYLGQEAVDHGIISADFLGAYLPTPPSG